MPRFLRPLLLLVLCCLCLGCMPGTTTVRHVRLPRETPEAQADVDPTMDPLAVETLTTLDGDLPMGPGDAPDASENTLWLENRADAQLWTGSGAGAKSLATIPPHQGLFEAQVATKPVNGRVFVFYPGDTSGVEAGYAWVDAATLRPASGPPAPGPLDRSQRMSALISPYPRSLPRGTGRVFEHIETSAPLVALTLDDGIEQDVLDVLADRGVKATLFLSGSWVEQNPDAVIRALPDGHELGNHSYSHSYLTTLGEDGISTEITRANLSYSLVTEAPFIALFRPPYGAWDDRVAREAQIQGFDICLWDVDSYSYQPGATAESVVKAVVDAARPGSIILMHPLTDADRKAMGDVIDGLRAKGLEPTRLSDVILSADPPKPHIDLPH